VRNRDRLSLSREEEIQADEEGIQRRITTPHTCTWCVSSTIDRKANEIVSRVVRDFQSANIRASRQLAGSHRASRSCTRRRSYPTKLSSGNSMNKRRRASHVVCVTFVTLLTDPHPESGVVTRLPLPPEIRPSHSRFPRAIKKMRHTPGYLPPVGHVSFPLLTFPTLSNISSV
jgi:hypothetical protein